MVYEVMRVLPDDAVIEAVLLPGYAVLTTHVLDCDDEARVRGIAAAVGRGAGDGRAANTEDAAGLRQAGRRHAAVYGVGGADGVADPRSPSLSRLHDL